MPLLRQPGEIDHDVERTSLSGGARESCAFRAGRRRLSCFPTYAEHTDQKTRGISRSDPGGSRREDVRADGNRTGGGRESTTDRRSSRYAAGLEAHRSWALDGAAQLGRDSDPCTVSSAATTAARQGALQALATRGARGPDRAPAGAAARLSDRCGSAGAAGGRRGYRGDGPVRRAILARLSPATSPGPTESRHGSRPHR